MSGRDGVRSAPGSPVGVITRGTTAPNRLRRVDRWLTGTQARRLRTPRAAPVVVDLGYGASPVTPRELRDRLRVVRPDVRVVGLEIDPDRVARARPLLDPPSLTFARGGFEVPLDGGARPLVVRAFNVLRQYEESDVARAWERMVARLADGGLLVEGTCDEIGRLAAWVAVDATGPRSLTLSWRLGGLERPGVVAERLPKALIHRNVPGEPVHDLLTRLDAAWVRNAALAPYGARQRFVATVRDLRDAGEPVAHVPARWRLGELEVPWSRVAPLGSGHGATLEP